MNVRNLLSTALDPGRILQAQGMTPDSWQRDVLMSPSPRILLNCCRGAGKSRVGSALALHAAMFQPGSLVLLLSRALRQAVELLRQVKQGLGALGRPLTQRRRSETVLELSNGSRVLSLPGREETIRAYQGVNLILIDEAARVPDALYFSVRPMLNVSRGRLVCLSTPFGARGFFWKEWHDERADWKRVHITWRDCPRIPADAVEDERRAMGDLWTAQEYEGSFLSMEGQVYPEFDRAAIDVGRPVKGRAVGGIDFGWRNPFAAVWGTLDADDVLWIEGERYAGRTPIHQHAQALRALGSRTWYADPSGRTEIEELRAAGLTVLPGTNDLRCGIAAVNARLRTGRLKVVRGACPHLMAEARTHHYPTVGGEIPVDADNHALAALRYLVSRLDARLMSRLRRRETPPSALDEPEGLWTTIG